MFYINYNIYNIMYNQHFKIQKKTISINYNQFSIKGIKENIYKDSKLLEELLANDISLNNLKNKNMNIII